MAGHDLEWSNINYVDCSRYFCGASEEHNPWMITEADQEGFQRPVSESQRYKVGPTYDYGRALEGASGCIRACMIHLEERGVLQNKFHDKFRRRKPWTVDWTEKDEASGTVVR